jgi:hypothetical protein
VGVFFYFNDLVEPEPFGSRFLTVLFTNPKLSGADWGYTSDFRKVKNKPGGAWPFVVRASSHVSTVTSRSTENRLQKSETKVGDTQDFSVVNCRYFRLPGLPALQIQEYLRH